MKNLFALIALVLVSFTATANQWAEDDAAYAEEEYSQFLFTTAEAKEFWQYAMFCREFCPRDHESYWAANELIDSLRQNFGFNLHFEKEGIEIRYSIKRVNKAFEDNNQYAINKEADRFMSNDSLFWDAYEALVTERQNWAIDKTNAIGDE
jgi:hypothetical protein